MLIVIGNIQRLRNSAAAIAQRSGLSSFRSDKIISENASRIRKTLDALFSFADISPREVKQLKGLPSKKVGNHAVFVRVVLRVD
jgi:hypothetical protein